MLRDPLAGKGVVTGELGVGSAVIFQRASVNIMSPLPPPAEEDEPNASFETPSIFGPSLSQSRSTAPDLTPNSISLQPSQTQPPSLLSAQPPLQPSNKIPRTYETTLRVTLLEGRPAGPFGWGKIIPLEKATVTLQARHALRLVFANQSRRGELMWEVRRCSR